MLKVNIFMKVCRVESCSVKETLVTYCTLYYVELACKNGIMNIKYNQKAT